MRNASIVEALARLSPGAEYTLEGDDLTGLVWLDGVLPEPSESTITDKVDEVEAEWATEQYQRNRDRTNQAAGLTTEAMTEALWRNTMESDSDQADALQVIRDQTAAEYPVPQE